MSNVPNSSRKLSSISSTPNIDRVVLGSADLTGETAAGVLERFRLAGGSKLDLANVYGDGNSSLAVGAWLRAAKARDDFTLYVKGCHPPYCAPDRIRSEVEHARALLNVDRLDAFILHRDDPGVPTDAWGEALLAEADRGSIREFGVSNWTMRRFDEMQAALGSTAGKLTIFSNHFSLAEMITPTWPGCLAMTRDEISALSATGMTPLAWASIAGGYFAGRDVHSWHSDENAARRERAGNLGKQLDVTPAAVALAFVLHQPGGVLAAIGTRSPTHLDELLAATELRLSTEQLTWLEQG